jgi:hypothetical protein
MNIFLQGEKKGEKRVKNVDDSEFDSLVVES